jgi:hypothetical protein
MESRSLLLCLQEPTTAARWIVQSRSSDIISEDQLLALLLALLESDAYEIIIVCYSLITYEPIS